MALSVSDLPQDAQIPSAPSRAPTDIPEYAVEIRGLVKVYRGDKGQTKRALDGVSLSVRRGELFGLLGPNGAGKSTLINIMAGLVNKTAGSVRIWNIDLDRDPRGIRAAIGVVPQELNLDAFFTPRELLDVQAGLYGVPRAERRTDEILRAVGLADKAEAYARTLSGGMRRRLLVAKALVHAPPVLVLDEPTAGVDVELRQHLWSYVRELNARGTTVLLTTHYLPEAEELCDRIAIINHGRLVALDTKKALLARLDSKALHVTIDRDLDAVPPALAAYAPQREGARRLTFRYEPSRTQVGGLLSALQNAGLGIVDVSTEESDLEDIFLELTRRPAGELGGEQGHG
jgi:ABC-2 type transport system ATP-binding protein